MAKHDAGAEQFAPITRPYTLASGRTVTFEQPDLWELASGGVDLPNATKADIWELLMRGGSDDPTQRLLSDERYVRSLYKAAQLVIRPRLRLDDEDDKDAPIHRKELSLPDLMQAYSFLRFGPPPLASDYGIGAGEATAPASDGVSPPAE